MKNRVIGKFVILAVALSSALSLGAWAQTTEDGPGPSEQPSAPMEIGTVQEQDIPPANPQSAGPQEASPDAQSAEAQPTEAQPGGPSGEAPARTDQGVARVSLIHGDVSTQRGDSGDWSAAVLNQPVMTGDKLSTGDNARAELQLDFANVLRLGPNSKANVANLTKKNIQIQLAEGLANYSVSKDSEAEPEIDTPNVSIHPAHHDGVFRIEVRSDGDTIVIVRKGEAQIATPQGSTEIRSGDMATIRGNSDSAQYKISPAPDRDDWDQWNSDRDHMIANANSWRHTNRYYTGTQDLDAYGQWRHLDDYGDVWYPNQSDDWAPYRNGNWVYEPYYGWTWVGYEPWGWAPYHYGRWIWAGGGWGWWPGPVYGYYRPFWAPAYVSFWGWGGGFGFGIGFGGWGGFGWLPLGPGDWFHPWWGGYGGRFGYVRSVNVVNINHFGGIAPLRPGSRFSTINNLNNVHVARAMSTMNAGRFGTAGAHPMAARPEQMSGARMMAGNLPVVPTHASLSASGRAAAPSTIRNGGAQSFYGTHNTAHPASFAQQTASLRQSMQQNHVGAIPAGAGRSNSDFAAHNSSLQRPSAGISSNRPFTPPNASNRAESNNSGFSRSESQRGTTNGFRPFTPPSHSNASGESAGGYWNRTAPSYSSGRSYSDAYGRGSSRPQLDMNHPIARTPSYGGSYGGYRGAPIYGGSHSTPSYGGGHAPSGSGHPSSSGHASGGGGGHSGGGGHGGGGGHR